jgi:dGTPase
VDWLEHPYPAFMGLNLMYETRLGLGKHKSRYDRPHESPFDEQNCTLEGQVADAADRIAYDGHDLEDGMRARLIEADEMQHIEIFVEATERAGIEQVDDWTIRRTRTAKALLDSLVGDCIDSSREAIAAAGVEAPRDACANEENLIRLSADSDRKLVALEAFLFERFYQHESLLRTRERVRCWLGELFERLCDDPGPMPSYYRSFIAEHGLHRVVCDYIAGMTDRYCLKMLESDH